jgi:tetratricopeptide (TPR) repeat protein
MKQRIGWIVLAVVIVVVIVGVVRWWPNASQARLDKEIARVSAIEDPHARLTAIVEVVRSRPLDSARLKEAAKTISEAAYGMRGREGIVAVEDSLAKTDLPKELVVRLKGDVHNALVSLGYAAEEGAKTTYWRRANAIARELLAANDVPADVYLSMAGYQTFALEFAPVDELAATRGRLLPFELAVKGSSLLRVPATADDVFAIDRGVAAIVDAAALTRGPEAALVVVDSLLTGTTDPRIVAGIQANRYRLAAENDPAAAVAAARAFGAAAADPGFWNLLNEVGYDLTERNLEPALALELTERALANAPSKEDSTYILDSVGWAQYRLGNFDKAAELLEKTIDFSTDVPSFDNAGLQHLLAAYEAAKKNDKAIDLLARMLARSVLPNEEARKKLATLLVSAGRSATEIPALVESLRYEGVTEAPAFALADGSGKTVALADLKGKVVLVNFWSYG